MIMTPATKREEYDKETMTIEQFAELAKARIDAWAKDFKGGKEHAGCSPGPVTRTRLDWGHNLIHVLVEEVGLTALKIYDEIVESSTSTKPKR